MPRQAWTAEITEVFCGFFVTRLRNQAESCEKQPKNRTAGPPSRCHRLTLGAIESMDWLGRAATGPKAAGMRTSRPSALGLSALLATSSVAALLIGTGAPPAYAIQPCQGGGIAVVGVSQGSVTNSAPISCIYISNSTISGSVTNAGSGAITTTGPPSSTGITVNNSTVTGAVSNAGTIAASGNGIAITGNASIGGGIGNSGMLSVGGSGIVVNGPSTFAGGISNSGAIT
ncbi:MAG TPA: hypothetical protein VHY10_10550, partial [Xanthobacteraceae bacterium]|nr:hypothetical protein [Xanthobacteraceae bacterium]